LYAISLREIAYNITIHPLARTAGEGAGGVRADNATVCRFVANVQMREKGWG